MTYRCAALLAVLAAGLAGCGGSGVGTSPASYRASVNRICATYNAKIKAMPTSATSTMSGIDELEADGSAALAKVRAIKPPNSLSTAANRWIGSLSQTDTVLKQALAALQSGNEAEAQSVATKGSALNITDNAQASSLGLSNCAANPQPGAS